MSGFIKGHATELDANNDGMLSRSEVVESAERMFGKMDIDRDNEISTSELEAARRP